MSDAEYDVAQKGEYLLNLPIEVDLKRLDTQMLDNFFSSEGTKQTLPSYSKHVSVCLTIPPCVSTPFKHVAIEAVPVNFCHP